ncbi:Organic cation/carnitine transporter 2 [Platanthera zijinensis]|uniref:H(+)/Pi cotransporter n=1 Tax=Platanthera zijinensis TaxID=2320716 RepID=A0AAP0AX79_9ASPA
MEDTATAPLLPPYTTAAAATATATVRSIDDAIETYIGSTSAAAQLLPATLVGLAWAFDAQQTFINVFADAMPPWHCTSPSCFSAGDSASPCGQAPSSWNWSLPRHTSTISSWSLECASPALLALPSSSFFAGCLAGGILLATLADSRLGRKNTLVLSSLAMSLSAALTAASPSLVAYAALRFVCGFSRATVGTSALVLSTELVSRRWRDRVSIIGFFCFTMGFLSLPAIAYASRAASWRTLYLWTAVPALVYTAVIYFVIKESPRWLLVRGRKSEAIETIKTMTCGSRTSINSSFSDLALLKYESSYAAEEAGISSSDNIFSSAKRLWENRWAFRRLAALMTVSLGVGMVYYGMPLNLGNLSSNLYLSVALNALTELPSSLLVFFLVGRMNRRSSTLAFTAASCVFSLACAAMGGGGGWAEMAAELAAFFAACTSFSFVLIYSMELFPTCVRNSAIAMVRQALVVGGMVAPVLVAAGRRRRVVSFGVFGLAIGCFGVFAACLPETRGRRMSDTMEEEESKEVEAKRNLVP